MEAIAGENQYDVLVALYGELPVSSQQIGFAFKLLRDGQWVDPDPSQLVRGPAPTGAATERSWNPTDTELYFFKDGDSAAFYEVRLEDVEESP
jgi:hypothetical protein